MLWQKAAPVLLFGSLPVIGYSTSSGILKKTSVDESFYSDLDLVSRFDENASDYQSKIGDDGLGAKNYFFNNSFNLVWKDNSSDNYGNAFLINLLLPEWITAYHPDRYNYSPTRYLGGDHVELLLGTSFSFVSKLFPDITDWKTNVNETVSTTQTASSSKKLYFSHPWPLRSKAGSDFEQNFLYSLNGNNGNEIDIFSTEVTDPYLFSVDPSNISPIYAAIDLSINKKLLDISLGSSREINLGLLNLHHNNSKTTEWVDSLPSWGTQYKFAVDFAVIKVKLSISKLRNKFLDYLINLYNKREYIPKIIDADLEIKNQRTKEIYLAGWDQMSENARITHDMERVYVKSEIKSDQISNMNSKQASEYANETQFNQCCDLDLYDDSSSTTKSSTYEILDKKYYPNNEAGRLVVEFKVKHKSTGKVSDFSRKTSVWGFQEDTSSSEINNALKQFTREESNRNARFSRLAPTVRAQWKEYGASHSYFSFQTIPQLLMEQTYSQQTPEISLTQPNRFFDIGDSKYLNIGHQLILPNINMKKSKGTLAIMEDPYADNEKVMVGIYDGANKWTNYLSNKERYVGNVTMFISPWRYDLFNENNNLSKPSLGDALKKKCLDARIIQNNRFKLSRRNLEEVITCPASSSR